MKTTLGRSVGRIAWESPRDVLLGLAEELHDGGYPLGGELVEMIRAAGPEADRDAFPTRAAAELFATSMTAAESTSTLLLATLAARARDAALDDEALLRTMAAATVLVARFDSYVAERGPARAD